MITTDTRNNTFKANVISSPVFVVDDVVIIDDVVLVVMVPKGELFVVILVETECGYQCGKEREPSKLLG